MKARHHERGASVLESALVVGVLLAVVLGIVEFGRFMYTYAYIAQIAREGARWAIVRGSGCTVLNACGANSTQVANYVASLSEGVTNPANLTATATWPNTGCPPGSTGNAPGCPVVVKVTYQYGFTLIPFLASVPVTLSTQSQMVISQ
jgi:Flp pilus assembly protein TadG